eukprot:SAG11_NODE_487_length_8999_cov_16.256966_3_plen_119_part_00
MLDIDERLKVIAGKAEQDRPCVLVLQRAHTADARTLLDSTSNSNEGKLTSHVEMRPQQADTTGARSLRWTHALKLSLPPVSISFKSTSRSTRVYASTAVDVTITGSMTAGMLRRFGYL